MGDNVYIGNGTSGAAQIYIKPEGLSNAFPNPTSGNIKVKYQLPENENSGKIELTRIIGFAELHFVPVH
jgi:hypothetical protein